MRAQSRGFGGLLHRDTQAPHRSHVTTSRILGGMPLSLRKKDLGFFTMFFIRLFRDTFYIVFSAFFALSRDSISLKKVILFYFCRLSGSDPTYINILWGSQQRHLLWRFRGVDHQEDAWRHLLACAFLGSRSSGPRSDASRSSPENP